MRKAEEAAVMLGLDGQGRHVKREAGELSGAENKQNTEGKK